MGLRNITLKINGKELKKEVLDCIQKMSIKDERGTHADTVTVEFVDNENFEIPKTGALVEPFYIEDEKKNIELGQFYFDDIEVTETSIIISAKGFNAEESGLKEVRQYFVYKQTNLYSLVSFVAKRAKLQALIDSKFKNAEFSDEVVQENESDLHFLNRLAEQANAVLKFQGEKLLFVTRGDKKTVSGKPLKAVPIKANECISFRYLKKGREKYKSVEIAVFNEMLQEVKIVKAGNGEPVLRVKGQMSDEKAAKNRANALLKSTGYNKESLNIKIEGNPTLRVETPIIFSGSKKGIDGEWVIENLSMDFENSFTMDINCTKEEQIS